MRIEVLDSHPLTVRIAFDRRLPSVEDFPGWGTLNRLVEEHVRELRNELNIQIYWRWDDRLAGPGAGGRISADRLRFEFMVTSDDEGGLRIEENIHRALCRLASG